MSDPDQNRSDQSSDVTPPPDSYARFMLHSEYRKIALDNLEKVEALEKRRREIVLPDDLAFEMMDATELDLLSEAEELEEAARHPQLIAIVFAAMYLEAFIYDYACLHLSEADVERYLDRLDPVRKWEFIPRLVTGAGLDQSSHVFEAVNRVINVRNRLVHYKSSDLDYEKLAEQLKQREKHYEIETRKIRIAVTEPVKLLEKLHSVTGKIWYRTDF
jgi:hypothetical protein